MGKYLTDITNTQGSTSNSNAVFKKPSSKDTFSTGNGGTHNLTTMKAGKENEKFVFPDAGLQCDGEKITSSIEDKPRDHLTSTPLEAQSKEKDGNTDGNFYPEQDIQSLHPSDIQASSVVSSGSVSHVSKRHPRQIILIDDDEEDQDIGIGIQSVSRTCNSLVSKPEIAEDNGKTCDITDFKSHEVLSKQQRALEMELETRRVNIY